MVTSVKLAPNKDPKTRPTYRSRLNSDSPPQSFKSVVTIPENLPLSNSEKLVISKGFNFVPISEKKPTNFHLSKAL